MDVDCVDFLSAVYVCVFKMEEDPFNPDYVEVDRVLEVSYCQDKDTGEVTNCLCVFGGHFCGSLMRSVHVL